MKKIIALLVLFLSACGSTGGDGSGSTSTGGTYYTHEQLAYEFVHRLNVDIRGYDLEIVRTDTQQRDYIVVWDNNMDRYDAYYIGAYNVGEDLRAYLNNYSNQFYHNLEYDELFDEYYDYDSGLWFEKKTASSKDLAVLKAFKEEFVVEKAAEQLRDRYGLSESKSMEVASIVNNISRAPAGSITATDIDRWSAALTGSTVTEFQNDYKSGNVDSLERRISKAGELTGMGPEATEAFIKDMFN